MIHDAEYSVKELLVHENGGNINRFILDLPELPPVGELLKEGRLKRELSQKELAELTGVKNFEISRIESGVTAKPSKETLLRLAPYIGLPYSELLLRCGYSGVDNKEVFYSPDGQVLDCNRVIAKLYYADFEIIQLLEGIDIYDPSDIVMLKDFLHILNTSAELRITNEIDKRTNILLESVKNAITWLGTYINSIRVVLTTSFV